MLIERAHRAESNEQKSTNENLKSPGKVYSSPLFNLLYPEIILELTLAVVSLLFGGITSPSFFKN